MAGDLGLLMVGDSWMPWRLWGGLLNCAAVVLFLANTGRSLRFEAVGPRPNPA